MHVGAEHNGRRLASPAQLRPSHVRRDFSAQQRLQGTDIRRDAGCDPLEEGLIQRREFDRLPHARPSFIPSLDAHVRAEGAADGALA